MWVELTMANRPLKVVGRLAVAIHLRFKQSQKISKKSLNYMLANTPKITPKATELVLKAILVTNILQQ